jgi:cell wall-associated NlpC family hydrolase
VRTLHLTHPPEHGDDVRALQQLLGVAATGQYDEAAANAVYRKKLELGYLTPDHDAGDQLMSFLTGTKHPSAAMVKRAELYRRSLTKKGTTARPATVQATATEKAAATEAAVRAKAVSVMHLLISSNPKIHYPAHDVRTMTIHAISTLEQLQAKIASNALTIDCSQAVTLIAHVAGAKDPNGGNWASDGYTGTLLEGCKPISRAQAKPGDLRVFGGGTGHHVCMVIQPGANPLLFSHGQENDPIAISESVELKYQPPGGTFLRLPI